MTEKEGLDELVRGKAVLPDQGAQGGGTPAPTRADRGELRGRGGRGGESQHEGPDEVSLQVDTGHSTL